jgi:hypothetical protein
MRVIRAFLAGFVSTLVFHQGMLALLHAARVSPRAPFAAEATRPFGVPQFLSLAFWGGVWGILLVLILRGGGGFLGFLVKSVIFGALAPSLVAWLVVFPLKHQPVAGGGRLSLLATGLLVNGAWGLGTALLFTLFGGRSRRLLP